MDESFDIVWRGYNKMYLNIILCYFLFKYILDDYNLLKIKIMD